MQCVCYCAVHVPLCLVAAVSLPVQPDWLFNRPSLTMDFVSDTTQPPDPVSNFYLRLCSVALVLT